MSKSVIGVDPDLHKSGIAVIEDSIMTYCLSMPMWELFDFIENHVIGIVLLEAGHLNKNTWHAGGRGASKNVGKNQAVGIIIEEFLKAKEIPYRLIVPKGYSDFFKKEDFFKRQTGFLGKTNQDARAAAAIAYLNY